MNQFLQDFPKTILISEKRLKPIFERSFPKTPVYSYGVGPLIATNTALINGYIPIGSFQKKYRSNVDGFLGNRIPYLKPLQEKVEAYRELLLEKTGAKKIVGFSWKGGFWERSQATKTMAIDLWDPILSKKDVIFVSLQYGNTDEEKKRLAEKYQNIRWIEGIDFKKDLDSWFALICACDDIISVSTALVHFAGAAGKSVHLLLSDRGAPFIWGLTGKTSIAYQNVKIYRKEADQDYSEFFEDVATSALTDKMTKL
jgi:ADP-heptose:LPS heptosyltransferase